MVEINGAAHSANEPETGDAVEHIADEESLYRRAPSSCIVFEGGVERISSSAFNDRGHKPSVDRARMLESVERAKLVDSDGVLTVSAADVRAIRDIEITNPATNPPSYYAVDVYHRPVVADESTATVANPAHAQIEASPHPDASSRFKKVKEALALIANRRGWIIRPQ